MINRVRAIIIENGCILLIHRRKKGEEYWVFPGGGIEESDHNPKEALQRECEEELGVKVDVGEVVKETADEAFFSCSIVGGMLGTGNGPEFQEGTLREGTFALEWLLLESLGGFRVLPESVKKELEARHGSQKFFS